MCWLLIFGQVLSHIRAIPTGNVSYLDFMSPGILAQSVLFISIFYGIAVISERDLGMDHDFPGQPHAAAAPSCWASPFLPAYAPFRKP